MRLSTHCGSCAFAWLVPLTFTKPARQIVSFFQMEKVGHGEIKQPAQGHTVSKGV